MYYAPNLRQATTFYDPKSDRKYPLRKPLSNPTLYQLLPRWAINRSSKDLGLIRFAFELFPHTVKRDYGVARWVRPGLYQALRYYPGISKIDRANAICTPREFSKTTWFGKILPLYLMLVGQYGIYYENLEDNIVSLLPEANYIRLRAKNQEKAEEKLSNIIYEFGNDKIIELFGDLRPSLKEIKDKKLKNAAKLAILKNKYIFQAQGINKPARGANIRDLRPKVDINDDAENKENTKTETSRYWNAKEVMAEQFGGLSPDGLTIYIGNYVHEDCLMAHLQKEKSGWKRQFYQATYIDGKGYEKSLWPERFSVSYIRKLGDWYRAHEKLGGWKMYMMEYYNKIVADHDYQIKHWKGKIFRKNNENFLAVFKDGQIKPEVLRAYIVVSGDPAISSKKGTSNGVASVIVFGSDSNRYIIHASIGKFDIVDRYYYPEEMQGKVLATTSEDIENIKRVGLVSEMGRLLVRYQADAWALENAGQQLAWFNDLNELTERLIKKDLLQFKPVQYAHKPRDEKTYKNEVGVMNHIAVGRYYFKTDMVHRKACEIQVQTFPDNKQDIIDTWYNAEQIKKIPPSPHMDALGRIAPEEEEAEEMYTLPEGVEGWILGI